MPVMNRSQATRRIRAYEVEEEMPASNIEALTDLGNSEIRRTASSHGIDLFLGKPIVFALKYT